MYLQFKLNFNFKLKLVASAYNNLIYILKYINPHILDYT